MKERALMLSPKGYDLPKFSLQLLNMILSSAFCHSDPKQVILKKKTEKLHTYTYMYLYRLRPSKEALIFNFPNKDNGLIQGATNL